jgi:PPOX class probable F420-dependent enzyme
MLLDPTNPRHASAAKRLRDNLIVWLGTTRPDGRPHMVPVWYHWDPEDNAILIFSKPDQKIRNLRQNPNAVLGLDDTDTGEFVILIEGTAALLPREEINTTLPAYAQKYAAKLSAMGWTPESMSQSYTEPIRVTPTRIRVG